MRTYLEKKYKKTITKENILQNSKPNRIMITKIGTYIKLET